MRPPASVSHLSHSFHCVPWENRKLGVFAAVVLLLSFSCFSWVRSPAGKASGGYYSGAAQVEWNRLVSPEALEVSSRGPHNWE